MAYRSEGHTLQATPLLFDTDHSLPVDRHAETVTTTTPRSVRLRQVVRFALSSTVLRPAHIYRLAKRCGYAFVPQPARDLIWKDHAPPRRKLPTSYLTGLRGCTALKVFTFHYMHAFTDATFMPYASTERYTHFLEFPIIRYFWSGFTSHIFFGVAGYLTSLRLLQMMDDPNPVTQAKVMVTVSASLFRRAFRLYLPVFIITLMTSMYIYFGYYEYNRRYLTNHTQYFPGDWNEEKPPMYPTLYLQLHFWAREMSDLSNFIWEKTDYPWLDQHLWSILSEMRASLHLYICLMMLSLCTRQVRLIFFGVLTLLYFWWNHWEIWVYILGAMVAQIDIILTDAEKQRTEKELPLTTSSSTSSLSEKLNPNLLLSPSYSPSSSPTPRLRLSSITSHLRLPRRFHTSPSTTRTLLRYLAFFIAFYLLSYPIKGPDPGITAPGYMTLNRLIPKWMERKDKFYSNIGTILLLFLLVRSHPEKSKWRRFLDSPLPQYMGSISFGFYLVHAPVMHVFGYMVPQWVWWKWLGLEGPNDTTDLQWIVGILCGWVPTLIVSLWAADVWVREVEGRCTKVVKALEARCFREKAR